MARVDHVAVVGVAKPEKTAQKWKVTIEYALRVHEWDAGRWLHETVTLRHKKKPIQRIFTTKPAKVAKLRAGGPTDDLGRYALVARRAKGPALIDSACARIPSELIGEQVAWFRRDPTLKPVGRDSTTGPELKKVLDRAEARGSVSQIAIARKWAKVSV